MPDIEHSTITDPDIHEPKGISSLTVSDAGKVYTPSGTGTGSWRLLTDDDLDFSDASKNKFGWIDISDSAYTSGTPLAIAATTRTQLPNNGLAAQSDTTRLSTGYTSNAFNINDLNAFYVLRINFKCTAAAAAGTPYVMLVELETANGPTSFTAFTQFIKGGGYVNRCAVTFPIYIGSFINNYAMKVYLTPDTAVNVYDIGYVVERAYIEA